MMTTRKIKLFGVILAFAAVICCIWVLLIPGEGGILFGMSPARFGLFVFLVGIGALCLAVAANFKKLADQVFQKITNYLWINSWLSAVAFFSLILGVVFPIMYALFTRFAWTAIIFRVIPLTTFFYIFGFVYAALNFEIKTKEILLRYRSAMVIFLITVTVFIVLLIGSLVFRLGLIVDPVYWMKGLPIPVFPAQLGLIFLTGLILTWFFTQLFSIHPEKAFWLDLLLCVGIWCVAFYVWSGYAIPNTYFSPRPLPPTYEVFPFSDARGSDLSAFSLTLGDMNLNSRIPAHPLYAYFLGMLHGISGPGYSLTISLQTAVLSLFPVMLYLIGLKISGRLAGIIAAILIILREANTLSAASLITTSNSKLYLTEMPTAFLVSIFILLLIGQLQHKRTHHWKWLLIGGVAGLMCLLRLQTVLLLLILILAIFIFRKWLNAWIQSAFLLIIGFFLVVSPWLARNYTITGSVVFEDPKYSSRSAAMISLQTPEKHERENIGEYTDVVGTSLKYIVSNPLAFLSQTANHFARNELLSLYALPILAQPIDGVKTLFIPENAYWSVQRDLIPEKDGWVLLLAIIVIGSGVAVGYQKIGWPAVVPLLAHWIYNLSSSIFRFSGWRYALSVDWVFLLYLAIASSWLIYRIVSLYQNKLHIQSSDHGSEQSTSIFDNGRITIFVGVLLFAFGLSLPVMSTFHPSYPKTEQSVLMREIQQNPQISQQAKQKIEDTPAQMVLKGIGLYPRFYKAGEGEPSSDAFYKARDYARLLFVYIGTDRFNVELATNTITQDFGNADEIYIGGQMIGEDFYADWVLVNKSTPIAFFAEKK